MGKKAAGRSHPLELMAAIDCSGTCLEYHGNNIRVFKSVNRGVTERTKAMEDICWGQPPA
jgi:hypothetical protein